MPGCLGMRVPARQRPRRVVLIVPARGDMGAKRFRQHLRSLALWSILRLPQQAHSAVAPEPEEHQHRNDNAPNYHRDHDTW